MFGWITNGAGMGIGLSAMFALRKTRDLSPAERRNERIRLGISAVAVIGVCIGMAFGMGVAAGVAIFAILIILNAAWSVYIRKIRDEFKDAKKKSKNIEEALDHDDLEQFYSKVQDKTWGLGQSLNGTHNSLTYKYVQFRKAVFQHGLAVNRALLLGRKYDGAKAASFFESMISMHPPGGSDEGYYCAQNGQGQTILHYLCRDAMDKLTSNSLQSTAALKRETETKEKTKASTIHSKNSAFLALILEEHSSIQKGKVFKKSSNQDSIRAFIDIKDAYLGKSALVFATESYLFGNASNATLIRLLLLYGANPSLRTGNDAGEAFVSASLSDYIAEFPSDRDSALMMAMRVNNTRLINMFMDSLESRDEKNATIVSRVKRFFRKDERIVLKQGRSYQISVDGMVQAIRAAIHGDLAQVSQPLMEAGLSIGDMPSRRKAQIENIQRILQYAAQSHAQYAWVDLRKPIADAIIGGRTDIVVCLSKWMPSDPALREYYLNHLIECLKFAMSQGNKDAALAIIAAIGEKYKETLDATVIDDLFWAAVESNSSALVTAFIRLGASHNVRDNGSRSKTWAPMAHEGEKLLPVQWLLKRVPLQDSASRAYADTYGSGNPVEAQESLKAAAISALINADDEKVWFAARDSIDGYGNNLLHLAMTAGDANAVTGIISALGSQPEKVQQLLFDPNARGNTPFHCAAELGFHHVIVTALTAFKGRSVQRTDNFNEDKRLFDTLFFGTYNDEGRNVFHHLLANVGLSVNNAEKRDYVRRLFKGYKLFADAEQKELARLEACRSESREYKLAGKVIRDPANLRKALLDYFCAVKEKRKIIQPMLNNIKHYELIEFIMRKTTEYGLVERLAQNSRTGETPLHAASWGLSKCTEKSAGRNILDLLKPYCTTNIALAEPSRDARSNPDPGKIYTGQRQGVGGISREASEREARARRSKHWMTFYHRAQVASICATNLAMSTYSCMSYVELAREEGDKASAFESLERRYPAAMALYKGIMSSATAPLYLDYTNESVRDVIDQMYRSTTQEIAETDADVALLAEYLVYQKYKTIRPDELKSQDLLSDELLSVVIPWHNEAKHQTARRVSLYKARSGEYADEAKAGWALIVKPAVAPQIDERASYAKQFMQYMAFYEMPAIMLGTEIPKEIIDKREALLENLQRQSNWSETKAQMETSVLHAIDWENMPRSKLLSARRYRMLSSNLQSKADEYQSIYSGYLYDLSLDKTITAASKLDRLVKLSDHIRHSAGNLWCIVQQDIENACIENKLWSDVESAEEVAISQHDVSAYKEAYTIYIRKNKSGETARDGLHKKLTAELKSKYENWLQLEGRIQLSVMKEIFLERLSYQERVTQSLSRQEHRDIFYISNEQQRAARSLPHRAETEEIHVGGTALEMATSLSNNNRVSHPLFEAFYRDLHLSEGRGQSEEIAYHGAFREIAQQVPFYQWKSAGQLVYVGEEYKLSSQAQESSQYILSQIERNVPEIFKKATFPFRLQVLTAYACSHKEAIYLDMLIYELDVIKKESSFRKRDKILPLLSKGYSLKALLERSLDNDSPHWTQRATLAIKLHDSIFEETNWEGEAPLAHLYRLQQERPYTKPDRDMDIFQCAVDTTRNKLVVEYAMASQRASASTNRSVITLADSRGSYNSTLQNVVSAQISPQAQKKGKAAAQIKKRKSADTGSSSVSASLSYLFIAWPSVIQKRPDIADLAVMDLLGIVNAYDNDVIASHVAFALYESPLGSFVENIRGVLNALPEESDAEVMVKNAAFSSLYVLESVCSEMVLMQKARREADAERKVEGVIAQERMLMKDENFARFSEHAAVIRANTGDWDTRSTTLFYDGARNYAVNNKRTADDADNLRFQFRAILIGLETEGTPFYHSGQHLDYLMRLVLSGMDSFSSLQLEVVYSEKKGEHCCSPSIVALLKSLRTYAVDQLNRMMPDSTEEKSMQSLLSKLYMLEWLVNHQLCETGVIDVDRRDNANVGVSGAIRAIFGMEDDETITPDKVKGFLHEKQKEFLTATETTPVKNIDKALKERAMQKFGDDFWSTKQVQNVDAIGLAEIGLAKAVPALSGLLKLLKVRIKKQNKKSKNDIHEVNTITLGDALWMCAYAIPQRPYMINILMQLLQDAAYTDEEKQRAILDRDGQSLLQVLDAAQIEALNYGGAVNGGWTAQVVTLIGQYYKAVDVTAASSSEACLLDADILPIDAPPLLQMVSDPSDNSSQDGAAYHDNDSHSGAVVRVSPPPTERSTL